MRIAARTKLEGPRSTPCKLHRSSHNIRGYDPRIKGREQCKRNKEDYANLRNENICSAIYLKDVRERDTGPLVIENLAAVNNKRGGSPDDRWTAWRITYEKEWMFDVVSISSYDN
jgi:hypothetical protein